MPGLDPASTSDCDVAIFGGGPAGIAAALTLRRHAPDRRVVLYTGPTDARRKLGETLPPGAQQLLDSLGLADALTRSGALPAYGTSAAWGHDQLEANEFIFHPERRGWHVERARFDAALLAGAAAADVPVVREAALLDAQYAGGLWHFLIRSPGRGIQNSTTAFAIDATGRPAVLATKAGASRRVDDHLVAVSVVYRLSPARPLRDTYAQVESRREGWWYSSLQPDGRLAVACFTDADVARELRLKEPEGWRAALATAPHTRMRAAPGVADDAPVLRSADTSMLDAVTGRAWLAAGDAASTFDPLSSQGILKALRQGTVAGYAIVDHLAGDASALPKYDALLRREHAAFLAAQAEHYGREQRWPHSVFWQRRHQHLDTAGPAPLAARSA